MRKIAEIRNEISALVEKAQGIDRNNVEEMEKALEELRALTAELNLANEVEAAEQRKAEQKLSDIQAKEGRSFSLIKFVRELSEGHLTGLEAEVADMGAEEYRRLGLSRSGNVIPSAVLRATGQNYTTAADGGNLIEQMGTRYVDVLKDRLVVAKMGATVLTDLVGTVPVITSAQISASWDAEAGAASVAKASFAKATLTPHRNYVQTAVTKDLLRQTSFDVEAFLQDLMVTAHANLLESAAIAGTGSGNQPTGILNASGVNTVAMGTNGAAITWKKVVEMETVINAANANRGKMGYITNAKVMGELKTIEKASNTGKFLLSDNGSLNGYPIEYTNLVPSNLVKGTASACSALIFGNYQDLYIGEWGGLDLVVDPYTKAGNGEVIVTINAWNDCLVAEPKSFAVIKDITTV